MNYREEVLPIPSAGQELLGVLCRPSTEGASQAASIAVLIIVGGPQYRAGSHRQFVALARRLAAAGHAALRFDHRGLGDSTGAPRSFEDLDEDIDAAIDALTKRLPECRQIVLWGLCDAASAALLYCARRQDSRVGALALLNPWVRSATGQARTQIKHYYRDRLLSADFWRKLLRGKVSAKASTDFLRAARQSQERQGHAGGFQALMCQGWTGFQGPILLQLSENDYTAREFEEHVSTSPGWRSALQRSTVQRESLADADHTLSPSHARIAAEAQLLAWLRQLNEPRVAA